jgi:uncharacterized protein (TIGR03435 family)
MRIIDDTNLTGKYDGSIMMNVEAVKIDPQGTICAAFQRDLGLTCAKTKVPTKVLVIVSASQTPAAN